jgi:hypothetical protein
MNPTTTETMQTQNWQQQDPRSACRLQPLGAIRSLEIVPSNGTKDERQGHAVNARLNLDNWVSM